MAVSTKYTRSVAGNTLNGVVDVSSLIREISVSAIVTSLDAGAGINVNGDVIDIWFSDVLSTSAPDDVAVLDALLAAHTGAPVVENVVSIVEVQEEKIKTAGGHFQFRSFDLDIPAGTAGDETAITIVFPFAINIVAAYLMLDAENKGDCVRSEVAPDTIVGAITSDMAPTDTVINVQDSVRDNTAVGYSLTLSDGTNTDNMGRVIDINGNAITMETAAVNGFAAATPTYVKQTAFHVPHARLPGRGKISIGAANLTSSYLAANTPIKIVYTNNGTVAKEFQIYMEYKY